MDRHGAAIPRRFNILQPTVMAEKTKKWTVSLWIHIRHGTLSSSRSTAKPIIKAAFLRRIRAVFTASSSFFVCPWTRFTAEHNLSVSYARAKLFCCMLRHEENLCLFCNLLLGTCLHNASTVCIPCDMFTLIHIIHCATLWPKTC